MFSDYKTSKNFKKKRKIRCKTYQKTKQNKEKNDAEVETQVWRKEDVTD